MKSRRVRGEACKVLLVAPLPPPMGGIARWTEQVLRALRTDPRVKIVHLDIYERASDSGDWIKESAKAAMEGA